MLLSLVGRSNFVGLWPVNCLSSKLNIKNSLESTLIYFFQDVSTNDLYATKKKKKKAQNKKSHPCSQDGSINHDELSTKNQPLQIGSQKWNIIKYDTMRNNKSENCYKLSAAPDIFSI